MVKGKEEELLKHYLKNRKVLIADTSAASRSGIFKVIHELGAATGNVILVNSFVLAQQAVQSARPDVLIVEYELERRCGLELLQTLREEKPGDFKNKLFVVVTGNTSQTAVARAAEEDVDAYILKPYTIDSIRRILLQAAIRKIRPSEYHKAIDAGKELLKTGKIDEAEAEFRRALPLDPTPSLACFYLGQAQYIRKVLDLSEGNYQKGLEYNRIHYKCMVGLYELMMHEKRHREAYEVVKRISQYFPANPKRLTEVLRLAVMNSQFADIEKYYAAFVNIDERNETLIRYVCAALVVCGKHYLSSNLGQARAIELFKKAVATGQGRSKIVAEIITTLTDFGLASSAGYFMERFPPEYQSTDDFLFMKFLVASAEKPPAAAFKFGRELMAKGYPEERLYRTLLTLGTESDLPARALQEIHERAVSKFPAKKEQFDGILAKAHRAGA